VADAIFTRAAKIIAGREIYAETRELYGLRHRTAFGALSAGIGLVKGDGVMKRTDGGSAAV